MKNFTAEELRSEINSVRNKFQTSGLRRDALELIILTYPNLFAHLLKKNLTKKVLKSHQTDWVNKIRNDIIDRVAEESFTGLKIANSEFTVDIIDYQRNGSRKFIIRDPNGKSILTGTTTSELIKTLTPIITNIILLTTRKRRIVLSDTDKTFINKTAKSIIKKLREDGIAGPPVTNPHVGINAVKKGRKYYFIFDEGRVVGPASDSFSDIEDRIVENYRKQTKKLRVTK